MNNEIGTDNVGKKLANAWGRGAGHGLLYGTAISAGIGFGAAGGVVISYAALAAGAPTSVVGPVLIGAMIGGSTATFNSVVDDMKKNLK